ncbi:MULTISPECIES: nSTAND1 domain-containing NTPase [unclassified Pseudoalteromonas]|uniref:nSTAND1 domain-containing NTPase n=1 Tax=unclassified Pseudoalteromonas TaxID=194690 RepID=UPI0016034F3A|nr:MULTISPECIES: winged helix-turn-helix domain-containing protein [unclassified Pseudoalteromonas]MBB1333112.1 winged helix-turn-helix domain-containing protein [Pseudoalteromonas sp. SR41-6]MBB1457983.1 winged helix-turn-helix domain-containing protein [Pseudoalteromonas sp. SG41-8]
MRKSVFFVGEWQVTPATNSLRRGAQVKQLEPKAMDVLLLLCEKQGELVSSDEIINHCWRTVAVGDNPLHKVITQLRKAFDDKASDPQYIETIRKRGYRVIAKIELPLDEEQKASHSKWQGSSPFVGLSAFTPNEADVFFGRSKQINTLLQRVSAQISFGRAFSLLLGSSGSGKSSLVNAGILPALMSESGFDGFRVESYCQLDFADITKDRLFLDLASTLLDLEINDAPVLSDMSADTLSELLQNAPEQVIEGCQMAVKQSQTAHIKPYLFLFIDRLEVLLSSPVFSEQERSQFLTIIELLATSNCMIIFSACRNDFYPQVVNQPSLMAGKANGAHFDLLPPTRTELKQMIRLPALAAGLSWQLDPEHQTPLDEILCNETANNPDALPMLQYTLQQLYLQRSENDELLVSQYQALGGIEGAIGQKAEHVFTQLPKQQQSQLSLVLSKLITLHADGETLTSRAARWDELTTPAQTQLAQAMVDSRLFVSHLKNEQACFSLAHEALLRQWQRAIDWINHHQQSLAIKSRLQISTERWLNEHKHADFLLAQGKPLQEAQSLINNAMFTLSAAELSLIKASNRRAKRKKTVLQATAVALILLSFIATFMSVRSYHAEQVAQQKRLEAESLLGFMVGEFADKLRSVKRMDLLDGISNKALEYFTNQADEDNSLFSFTDQKTEFNNRFQYAQTLEAMGEVAYSRGKTDEAFTAFESARTRLEALLKTQPSNLELLTLAGANAFWLGQLHYDKSDYAATEPMFKKYQAYSETMYSLAPNDFNSIMELSYSHNSLGSLYLNQFTYQAAKQNFTQSLILKNKALELKPNNKDLLRDRADTISWLASTDEKLGNFNEALGMLNSAANELGTLLLQYPNDASLHSALAYQYIQQSYLLSYFTDKSAAYEKAKLATDSINQARIQDPDNNQIQRYYYRFLALQLMLSDDKKVNSKVDDILSFIAQEGFRSTEVINTQISLIEYFLQRGFEPKARALLTALEQSDDYKEQLTRFDETSFTSILVKLYLINAKLTPNEEKRKQYCQNILITLENKKSKSIYYTFPLIKAHTCLNREAEIAGLKNSLIKLGISNFEL